MNGIQNTELNGKIRFVISRYKQEFALVDKQERFKWEAIGWYQQFRDGCNAFLADVRKQKTGWEKANQHYQDFRAILVYLTFAYPEKYYFYKYSMENLFIQHQVP